MTDKVKLLLYCGIAHVLVACSFFYLGTTVNNNKPLSKSEYIQQQQAQAAPAPHKVEIAPGGYIRLINYAEGRSFLYESEFGVIKVFTPICGEGMLPVWPGMHVSQINYRWVRDLTRISGGCYALDFVEHAPTGDYQVK